MIFIFRQEARLSARMVEDVLAKHGLTIDHTHPNYIGSTPIVVTSACRKANGELIDGEDFPLGFRFGDGVTCQHRVRLRDGNIYYLSWVSLDSTTSRAALRTAREILETPLRNHPTCYLCGDFNHKVTYHYR